MSPKTTPAMAIAKRMVIAHTGRFMPRAGAGA
jgi:hypothetical protein